ncbi:hypothetical protein V6N11_063900 [Hibiscus sabdariffa]|uniref:Uncharacterized protein n=1 Tax=Hibiscus sabdariffa TaxID=183260 RepID=A0ABR2PMG8_9ROSI
MNLSTSLQHVIKSRHFSSGASSTSQKVRVGALGLGYAGGEAILCLCESRFGNDELLNTNDEILCLKSFRELGGVRLHEQGSGRIISIQISYAAALATLQAAFGRIKKSIIPIRPAVPM